MEDRECVREFAYFGSIVAASGKVDTDVEKKIHRPPEPLGL